MANKKEISHYPTEYTLSDGSRTRVFENGPDQITIEDPGGDMINLSFAQAEALALAIQMLMKGLK